MPAAWGAIVSLLFAAASFNGISRHSSPPRNDHARVQAVAYLKKVVVDTCTRGWTTWAVWTVKPGGAAAWAAQLRYSRCLGTIYARAHGCAVISRPALSRVTITPNSWLN